jgi:transcriptional regulator with XRE-family HTH domain
MTEIGAMLTTARGERTIHAIARATGINHAQLSRYERGIHLPSVATLHKLNTYYNLDWGTVVAALARDHAERQKQKGAAFTHHHRV